jgi:flagellar biosynthesis protein FlhA
MPGLINDQEARDRRERVRREADFYGAMDGAIRFTQRDALAAVLITIVNIVAGLIIGVFQHGLDLATAAETYTILTVGEGLVTAIPALLVSMAGGLITTRAASESNLGEEVAVQLLARSKPLAAAAGVLTLLAMIPGLPKFPFLFVAALLAAAAYANRQSAAEPVAAPDAPSSTPDAVEAVVSVDPLGIEVGYALVTIVDEKQGGTLLGRLRAIRRQIATETGMVVPPVHVADNLQLGPRTYAILVKGVEVARGELHTDRLLAINPGAVSATIEGTPTKEPAFGLPALWIAQEKRDQAMAAGYTVVDPTTAISTHLSEVIRTFLPDLLTRQQTKELVDRLAQTAPKLVEEIVPKVCTTGEIQRVLRQLLRERVPVRDLTSILKRWPTRRSCPRIPTSSSRPFAPPSVVPSAAPTRARAEICALFHSRPASRTRSPRRSHEPIEARSSRWIPTVHSGWPASSERCSPTKSWHNLCSCARRRCVRTSGACSLARFRTSRCCRIARYRRRCG